MSFAGSARPLEHFVRATVFPRALLASLPRRHHEIAPSSWDEQYASGAWDYLHSAREAARYALIVGYCRCFSSRAAVLDVGCGEGLLQRLLFPSYSRYLGIDLSGVAIGHARARASGAANTAFAQADGRDYVPAEEFDLVVFNECLYYFPQPLEVVRRYERHLRDTGAIILSNVISRRSHLARAQLAAAYRQLDRVTLTSDEGVSWELRVLRRSPAV